MHLNIYPDNPRSLTVFITNDQDFTNLRLIPRIAQNGLIDLAFKPCCVEGTDSIANGIPDACAVNRRFAIVTQSRRGNVGRIDWAVQLETTVFRPHVCNQIIRLGADGHLCGDTPFNLKLLPVLLIRV